MPSVNIIRTWHSLYKSAKQEWLRTISNELFSVLQPLGFEPLPDPVKIANTRGQNLFSIVFHRASVELIITARTNDGLHIVIDAGEKHVRYPGPDDSKLETTAELADMVRLWLTLNNHTL